MSDAPPPIDRRALLKEALEAVEQMQAKLDAERRRTAEPIAIVGMACRFPGGVTTPETYWSLLRDGVDAVSEIPANRWDASARARLARAAAGKALVHYGGFVDGLDRFDAKFFGISPREATTMDPQQRLILEVAWEALERAGQAPDRLVGSSTGVFIGITTGDYADLVKAAGPEGLDVYTATGNAHNAAAGRVSYVLGLNGPAMAIDTACSSSLVAVHLASQSLRTGESRLALAGGVNVILTPDPFVIFSRWGMMAPDGRCKTFDARADGFVRSEGCGIVVLKRLSDAEADGDEILAVIRGSAVNQDGASSGLTVPNGLAQQDVIRQALRVAGADAADVTYVEAHGTGTALGDPIELEALDAVLGAQRPTGRPLVVGSVKTNIGHLESASGVAGLMKVVLALQHGAIPAHLHFASLTPRVSLRGPEPIVPTATMPWPTDARKLAGVSSFGFSGTNAHIVLEAASTQPAADAVVGDRPLHVLALSAKSAAALGEMASRYADRVTTVTDDTLADVCFSAGTGRSHFAHRLAITAARAGQASAALRSWTPTAGRRASDPARPRIAFLFSGQGSQYVDMGRQLYETCPAFRQALDRCASVLASRLDRPLLQVLHPADGQLSPLDQTMYTQPALFALEYALAETWRAWGIVPSAVLGHSVGEYVAACVAGVVGLDDALALIAERGRLMQTLPTGGAMASIFADEATVVDALRGWEGRLALAAINAPDNVVVSGEVVALDEVLARLQTRGIQARRLAVSHAFHSPLMDPVLDEFTTAVARVTLSAPRIGLVSNVTGRLASRQDVTDPTYWRRHLREPVRFSAGVDALRGQGIDVFVEIGPSPALLSLARRGVGAAGTWLPSLRQGRGDWEQMLESLATLYTTGVDVDWSAFDRSYRRRRVPVPTYPFQRERYWVEARPTVETRPVAVGAHPLLGAAVELPGAAGIRVWEQIVTLEALPYVADHRVEGRVIVPATAYLEMMLSAGTQTFDAGPLTLSEIRLEKPLFLDAGAAYRLQLTLERRSDDVAIVRIYGRDATVAAGPDTQPWILHVTGTISRERAESGPSSATLDVDAIRRRCSDTVSGEEFYARLAERGNQWGPAFRGVTRVWRRDGEALSEIGVPAVIAGGLAAYVMHPAVADASGHVLAATIPLEGSSGEKGGAFVGGGIDRITLHRRPGPGLLLAHATMRPTPGGASNILTGDVTVLDEGGVVAELTGARLWYLDDATAPVGTAVGDDWLYAVQWRPTTAGETVGPRLARSRWLIFADGQGVGDRLADELRRAGHEPFVVRASTGPVVVGRDHAEIRPGHPDELAAVLTAWLSGSCGLDRVVHLWSLDAAPTADTTDAGLASTFAAGPVTVLQVIQALAREGRSPAPRVWLATRGAQPAGPDPDVRAVAQAPLWGFGRALATEHAELWGGLVDLDPGASPAECVEALLADVIGPTDEDQLAYRAGVRYAARLVRDPQPDPGVPAACRADASYLITGGLGGLGLLVARRLAEIGARRLVLVGRSTVPERATWDSLPDGSRWARVVTEIRALEALGAVVHVESLDVADERALRGLLARLVREGWPAVRGVIHAAGTVRYASIVDSTADALEAVARAKVAGAWALHTVFEKAALDFFVLFSSASAVLASPMVAGYAAANAFLDALAHHRRARELPALSIDWGLWGGIGMAEGLGVADIETLVARGMGTIEATRGLAVFTRLLTSPRAQVAVLPVSWRRWRELYPAFSAARFLEAVVPADFAGSAKVASEAPLRSAIFEGPSAQRAARLQEYLLARVAEVLRLDVATLDPGERIGTLGLDSLMALELRSRVEADIGVSIPMVQLLQGPSVEALAAQVIARDRPCEVSGPADASGPDDGHDVDLLARMVAQRPVGPDATHPLSYGQQALWFLYHLAPQSDAYNVLFTARLDQAVPIPRLQSALAAVVARHPMLRTSFALEADGPVQVAQCVPELIVGCEDVSALDPDQVREHVAAAARRPFDLSRGPVMRVTLFSRAAREHVLLVAVHHIAFDAWSFEIFLGELRELLESGVEGRPPRLPESAAEYVDFARWQVKRVGSGAGQRDRRFWEAKLGGDLPVLRLPFSRHRDHGAVPRGAAQELVIDADLTRRLRQVAGSAGATLYMLLLTGYALLLRRLAGQDEVVIGSPVAGRQHREFASVIGYFVNMLPMRMGGPRVRTFAELLAHGRAEVLEALDHQEYPFALMVKELVTSRDQRRTPVFQAVFNFIRSEDSGALAQFFMADDAEARLDLGDISLRPYPVPQQENQFELVLEMTEAAGTLRGRFKCDTSVFEPRTVQGLAEGFTRLLAAIARGSDVELAELCAVIDAEKLAAPAGSEREEIDL